MTGSSVTNSIHKQPVILAVDDSPFLHRILERRLKDIRAKIIMAESGRDAIELARSGKPDLILLDLGLPDMSGFEVLSTLKNDPETMRLPVILLTASDSSEDKVLGFELGAVDYVTKPFDTAELQARVRSTLRTQHLVKILEQKAQVDALTGLWNRAHLDQSLQSCIETAIRYDQPLTLTMCDIDHFKQINDTFGHTVGDIVLERFAQILTETSSQSDLVCRYGGEEFLIIQPMTKWSDAVRVAERFREAIEAESWASIQESLIVTASFGTTCLAILPEQTMEHLIEAADRALYHAKQTGRNRVSAYDPAIFDQSENTEPTTIRQSA